MVTGVSGSGKSSLAFDTVYAEGQRRYVETFSAYARQFLDRMDKPQADSIEGIPPAIAIDQVNPVRTSRSTVGTMTELNDHLKLLFARAARLYSNADGNWVRRDSPSSAARSLLAEWASTAESSNDDSATRIVVSFDVQIPSSFGDEEAKALLARQGYTRILARDGECWRVVQDRMALKTRHRTRLIESLEQAFRFGRGQARVQRIEGETVRDERRFCTELRCNASGRLYRDPIASMFSFNSPAGACDTCRGFGRVMGIDESLVVPDPKRSLAQGAVRPWQSRAYARHQRDLLRHARAHGIDVKRPWSELSKAEQRFVFDGQPERARSSWYGVHRFFRRLEAKSYRMHVRVLLSKYRSYSECPDCHGARLKGEALLWRIGDEALVERLGRAPSRHANGQILPGFSLRDLVLMPLSDVKQLFDGLVLPAPLDEAVSRLLAEIRARLDYLVEVGLGYLTLDRQSRTLSGGEVQRINLTTALGTSLVNALFVLDEPSIGLHARDMQRVVGVLHRLRNAGNSLLVVEHDEQVIRSADQVIDMGPGAGEAGGEIVAFASPGALARVRGSVTGRYLSGRERIGDAPSPRPIDPERCLRIEGARANNLKALDVCIPLARLVCVSGVSGSGKSTLVSDVLCRALAKAWGRAVESPGEHERLSGHELIDDLVLVDQSAIGKSTRSVPASYVGAMDAIRKLFAGEPLARERDYVAGDFSFNTGHGRCASCGGTGFEHVEMQFLSDVYLRCAACNGRRYRAPLLEVLMPLSQAHGPPRMCSIADVLDMTVDEACTAFASAPDVIRALTPLKSVGLGYLRLGQPVPTLSGGEAQRLKLAGQLAKGAARAARGNGTLFVLDEPTTGLHFADVAVLLQALHALVDAGHSVLVIEHHLDVLASADWIIDLGPQAGEQGGELVVAGTARAVMAESASHTGKALRERERARGSTKASKRPVVSHRVRANKALSQRGICVHHAREHNLKDVNLTIPRDQFTVVTGVSGSGKSTLAFDIVFAEGQRRYLESLNAYARQFVQPATRPDVDAVTGIPPTVAIEQRTSRGGQKSTVATMTELYHFLRLLYVKLATRHCPTCNIAIEARSIDLIVDELMRGYRGQTLTLLAPLVVARKGYYTDLAAWAAARGYSTLFVDGAATDTATWPRLDRFREHNIDLPIDAFKLDSKHEARLRTALEQALGLGKGSVRIQSQRREELKSTSRACPGCGRGFDELDPRLFSYNSRHGWCPRCFGTGVKLRGFKEEHTGEEQSWQETGVNEATACSACNGSRLNAEALAVRFDGRSIDELTSLSVAPALEYFQRLRLSARDAVIARDILAELRSRLAFLEQVGLGYLQLNRAAPTLSGGEAQRIRLAAQLGSNLQGVCYVLDEPTIGLHTRDNVMLLQTLRSLTQRGNTVLVVEHDEDTIRGADHLIDLGPGAGVDGGEVVAAGSLARVTRNRRSTTGRYLRKPLLHPATPRREVRIRTHPCLRLEGIARHNVRIRTLKIPLRRLVCVTGVSGSGKSTLMRDVLLRTLQQHSAPKRRNKPSFAKKIVLEEDVTRVLEVDQTPIGKTPRSCPATYVGFFDDIRRLFAHMPEASVRGYGPSRFSFNVAGGRCETCDGQGQQRIEMSFLPDVKVTCETCGGRRYNAQTLEVTYREHSIADVLAMSVNEARPLFKAHAKIHRALELLEEVGLGYLTLGQPSPTLSGGEAQRIKLVTELAKVGLDNGRLQTRSQHTVYVLDEPSIGLHMADVERLTRVLHRLVDGGNSVLLVEHNLDLVAQADWVVDLGPDGGDAGGRVVASGAPGVIASGGKIGHTAKALAHFLANRTMG